MSTSSSFSCNSQIAAGILAAGQNVGCEPQDVPALVGTLVELELMLLNARAIDLEAVSAIVRSDVGLTLQVLRFSRSDNRGDAQPWRISDCVIQLGDKLLGVARPMSRPSNYAARRYEDMLAFWKHSKLVATVAEFIAKTLPELDVDPEQAYIAGLLHIIDALPCVLKHDHPCDSAMNLCTTSDWVAQFRLPGFVNEMLDASRAELPTTDLTPLSRVVSFAQCWSEKSLNLLGVQPPRQSSLRAPYLQYSTQFFPQTLLPSQKLSTVLENLRLHGMVWDVAKALTATTSSAESGCDILLQ